MELMLQTITNFQQVLSIFYTHHTLLDSSWQESFNTKQKNQCIHLIYHKTMRNAFFQLQHRRCDQFSYSKWHKNLQLCYSWTSVFKMTKYASLHTKKHEQWQILYNSRTSAAFTRHRKWIFFFLFHGGMFVACIIPLLECTSRSVQKGIYSPHHEQNS